MANENREKQYKAGQEKSKCKRCTINIYDMPDHAEPWPAVFPCGLDGCPYETTEEQGNIDMTLEQLKKLEKK